MHLAYKWTSAVILISTVTAAITAAYAADSGTWQAKSSLPVPAVFAGTTLGPDGRIYVFGGEESYGGDASDATRIYDPKSNSWSAGAKMPVATDESQAALGSNGKIYVIGGDLNGPGRHASSANFEYDPNKNTWTRRAPMPSPRAGLSLVAAKNAQGKTLLYAIGGRDYTNTQNGMQTVEAYDPLTDSWSTMKPMPTPRHALAATVGPDGKIYVVGGSVRNPDPHYCVEDEVYDPRTDTWSTGRPLPHASECVELIATPGRHGKIYMLGGWVTLDKADHPTFYVKDALTGDWNKLPDAPTPRGAGGAVVEKDHGQTVIYFIGGSPTGASCDEYIPSRNGS